MPVAPIQMKNVRGVLDCIVADVSKARRVPTCTALAIVASGVLTCAASGLLACEKPRAAHPVACSPAIGGPEPALRALPVAPSGIVGASHHFHRDIPLHPKTPIERVDLASGARIYEAATVVAERDYLVSDLASLRTAFRAVATHSTMSGPRFVNRCAVGYERAPFPVGTAMDAPPSATDGTATVGDDTFVSFSDWRVFAGWEDDGIVADGHVYRFDPRKLYANLSSWMRLPAWSARNERPAAERATWDAYVCDLRAHETLHLETSRATARFLLEAIATLRAPSAVVLEAKFNVVLTRALDWGRDEDRRIDDYTGHGPILVDRPSACGPS